MAVADSGSQQALGEKKKRMCLDHRKVNTHHVTDIHLLPHLDELVEKVAGKEYCIILDLKDTYYQVMLDEESRDITTFTEGVNFYRFQRPVFGLGCLASIFVRPLQGALVPLLKNSWVKSYLDDIKVCGPTYGTILRRLDLVFEQMQKTGIKLNLIKCRMAQREAKLLGHIVNAEGYRPDPANIEAVRNMRPATNVKEVRRFPGMAGFYLKHIEKFSNIASPLTNLTPKHQPLEWTKEC